MSIARPDVQTPILYNRGLYDCVVAQKRRSWPGLCCEPRMGFAGQVAWVKHRWVVSVLSGRVRPETATFRSSVVGLSFAGSSGVFFECVGFLVLSLAWFCTWKKESRHLQLAASSGCFVIRWFSVRRFGEASVDGHPPGRLIDGQP